MRFLHAVHCVIFNNFYDNFFNNFWNCYLFWFFLLVLKKDASGVKFDARTQIAIYSTYKWEKSNKLAIKIKLIIFTTT